MAAKGRRNSNLEAFILSLKMAMAGLHSEPAIFIEVATDRFGQGAASCRWYEAAIRPMRSFEGMATSVSNASGSSPSGTNHIGRQLFWPANSPFRPEVEVTSFKK
jgi:hypothetical protein